MASSGPSVYDDDQAVKAPLGEADHRRLVGGLWDEMGLLQHDFLLAQGLKPDHRLLDIGCGSLRLGVRACAYLAPGNYWGTDISTDLLEAGYRQEIVTAGLEARLPRSNLVTDGEFTFPGLPDRFDFIMAQSVFTHLPLNHLRLCFGNLTAHLKGPCTAFFTVFMPTAGAGIAEGVAQKDGVVSWSYKDPFHHDRDDIRHAFRGLPWDISLIGDWNHPRNQQLVRAVLRAPVAGQGMKGTE